MRCQAVKKSIPAVSDGMSHQMDDVFVSFIFAMEKRSSEHKKPNPLGRVEGIR